MIKRPIFVTGIGTGIGKTIVSAVLIEKLKADYWKPIQSGDLDDSDTANVKSLVSNNSTKFHPEAYKLSQPFSPHKSAALDGIKIVLESICIPETNNQLIIEGAGGLMVPLNDNHLIIDLIKKLDAEVILVSKNYLGSINHTLMSATILKMKGIPIKKLIFNGEEDQSSEKYISQYLKIDYIKIPHFQELNRKSIQEFAQHFQF